MSLSLKLASLSTRRIFHQTALNGYMQKRNRPVCRVETNLPEESIPKEFPSQLSKVIADALSKPENVSFIQYRHTIFITWSIGHVKKNIKRTHCGAFSLDQNFATAFEN